MYPDLGLGDARDKAEVLRGDIARGIDPIKAEREQRIAQEAADTRPTFREVAIEYLHKRIRKEKNRRKLQVMFNSELLPVLGDMALEDISPEHVLVISRLIDRRGAEAQARDVFGYARVVLNFAVEQGMLAVSPLAGVKFGRPAKPRERYLSVWEIRLFWTKLDTTPMHDHYKTIMRLQLLLGRRVSEVAGMAREEINMDARIWTIPAERCKNAVELRVPLTKMAREIIKKYLRSTAGRLLFPNSLGILTMPSISRTRCLRRKITLASRR